MNDVDKVRGELARYEHPLLSFSAEETPRGVELVISLKQEVPGVHIYRAPVHPRDIAGTQFPWDFQRYLYDCLHDYMIELFVGTPQTRERPA